jgi:hypothetical protein
MQAIADRPRIDFHPVRFGVFVFCVMASAFRVPVCGVGPVLPLRSTAYLSSHLHRVDREPARPLRGDDPSDRATSTPQQSSAIEASTAARSLSESGSPSRGGADSHESATKVVCGRVLLSGASRSSVV